MKKKTSHTVRSSFLKRIRKIKITHKIIEIEIIRFAKDLIIYIWPSVTNLSQILKSILINFREKTSQTTLFSL